MKHLMIYEAFTSDVISKTNKFLSKKVGKNSSKEFIRQLNGIKKRFDFPISEIKDENIEYLSTKKAVSIKAPKDWKPSHSDLDYEIYAYKFWFSLENGFLGETGIGSKEIKYSESYRGRNKKFDSYQLDHIKNNLGIKKGKIEVVTDYSRLNQGQKVIGNFSDYSELERLDIATIFIENDNFYAIQSVASGGNPNSDNWQRYGRYSWNLGSIGNIGNDHRNLHIYTKTDDDLHYAEDLEKSDDNILNWNLPTDGKFLDDWRGNDIKIIENSDFCVVFYIDDVIKSGYKKVSGIKSDRTESKKGATALYTDEEIKKINVSRYFDKILSNMGIKTDSTYDDIRNLEKVIKMSICGKYPIYSLLDIDVNYTIRSFISKLDDLIRYQSDYELDNLRRYYIKKKRQNLDKSLEYDKLNQKYKKGKIEKVVELVSKIDNIIVTYINNQSISTISDLKNIYLKIDYLSNLLSDSHTGQIECLNYIIGGSYFDPSDYLENDIKKLENIIRYITPVFK